MTGTSWTNISPDIPGDIAELNRRIYAQAGFYFNPAHYSRETIERIKQMSRDITYLPQPYQGSPMEDLTKKVEELKARAERAVVLAKYIGELLLIESGLGPSGMSVLKMEISHNVGFERPFSTDICRELVVLGCQALREQYTKELASIITPIVSPIMEGATIEHRPYSNQHGIRDNSPLEFGGQKHAQ